MGTEADPHLTAALQSSYLPSTAAAPCRCYMISGCANTLLLVACFPSSCAEVLTRDGEVHVALCRGQGGTPADQPRREWHNSWQVVAVAAGAGFILSDVHPFRAETARGYECTGYRYLQCGKSEKICVFPSSLSHSYDLLVCSLMEGETRFHFP